MDYDYTLPELASYLSDLKIPDTYTKPLTFLDISRQPHFENVISNYYAFFLNDQEQHNYHRLFIDSLIELIQEKSSKTFQDFNNYTSETEYSTHNNGRIDLLIKNDSHSIIIENKINHHIKDNDLQDYWLSGKENRKKSDCIGIILSLKEVEYKWKEGSEYFINLTHLELIDRIEKNKSNYSFDIPIKFQVFLDDFIQNIKNLSTTNMTIQQLEFYKQEKQKIQKINELTNEVEKHLKSEFSKLDDYLSDFSYFNNGIAHYFVFSYNANPNLILGFGLNFDDPENTVLHMIVEPQREALDDRSIYYDIDFLEEEKAISFPNGFKKSMDKWAHFSMISISLSSTDLMNLSDLIINQLENKLLITILKKIDLKLKEN